VSGHGTRLIVELGSGDGESTFVLERVAKLWDALLVSVDIEDREEVGTYAKRQFVKSDDIAFAARFPLGAGQGLQAGSTSSSSTRVTSMIIPCRRFMPGFPIWPPVARSSFTIPTSRRCLSAGTAARAGLEQRTGVYPGHRGVSGADHRRARNFSMERNGWLIRHWSHCNGLMVLDRYA
jgi:hypothetical protein